MPQCPACLQTLTINSNDQSEYICNNGHVIKRDQLQEVQRIQNKKDK